MNTAMGDFESSLVSQHKTRRPHVIIKPKAKRNFCLIPNELICDTQMSIEARGMIVYLLAKPPAWELRTLSLVRDLGCMGKRLGRRKLARLRREATRAGYMARLPAQTHRANGAWGPFFYIVGMPRDVAAEVKRRQREAESS